MLPLPHPPRGSGSIFEADETDAEGGDTSLRGRERNGRSPEPRSSLDQEGSRNGSRFFEGTVGGEMAAPRPHTSWGYRQQSALRAEGSTLGHVLMPWEVQSSRSGGKGVVGPCGEDRSQSPSASGTGVRTL
ncbi:unnamed protein product, partial [Discosporangium mesarthrocarpum]